LIMKRTILFLLLALGSLPGGPVLAADPPVATNSAASPKPTLEGLFPDSVVAKGKGVEVKRSDVEQEVIRIKAQAAAANQPINMQQAAMLPKQVLEQRVRMQLLMGK